MENLFKRGEIIKRFSQKHKAIVVKSNRVTKCDLCLKDLKDDLRAKELKGNITLGVYHLECYKFYFENNFNT